jgi:hypothetical protein
MHLKYQYHPIAAKDIKFIRPRFAFQPKLKGCTETELTLILL